MNTARIEAIVGKIDLSTHDMKPKITVGTCEATGKPKIGIGLFASDNRVKTGLKAGGFWPPHTVVLESDDEKHVLESTLAALDKATAHENREHFRYDGKLYADPHAVV